VYAGDKGKTIVFT
jgi:ATP-dependent RNA helicase DDX21